MNNNSDPNMTPPLQTQVQTESEPAALSSQQKWDAFVQGARKIFSQWTCLCLAVENGWGGML